jgi:hypothetical protein
VYPRDVGHAARFALELPSLGCETLYVMGARNAALKYDLGYTERLLGFRPAHRYGA